MVPFNSSLHVFEVVAVNVVVQEVVANNVVSQEVVANNLAAQEAVLKTSPSRAVCWTNFCILGPIESVFWHVVVE